MQIIPDGFNSSHTLAYSIVGLQEANLAYHYPIIYWNCANLISDSGGEDGNANYGKISTAIGNFKKEGIKVTLPDINRTRFNFHPDVKNNEIVCGLKPIQGIGTSIAKAIIDHQTYTSVQDFYQKMQAYKEESPENKFGDTAMITLIKAGCFDALENKSRIEIMEDFIKSICNPVKNLKMANIEDLASLGLLTEAQRKYELRLYRFRKWVYQKKFFYKQTGKSPTTAYYILDRKFSEPYFYENFETSMTEGKDYEYTDDGMIAVKKGSLDRVFDKLTEDFRTKVLTNQEFIDKINGERFRLLWDEKCQGSIPKWEMDSLGFYYTGHELEGIDRKKYTIVNFDKVPSQPIVVSEYMYKGQSKSRFRLMRIAGTVIDKDKNKNTVTLLTLDGVTVVKFYKGQFNFYDRQISEVNEDGTKTVIEKSWFTRGTKLMITGYRREDQFIPKKYSDSIYKHTVQIIEEVLDDGGLLLKSDRAGQENEETLMRQL